MFDVLKGSKTWRSKNSNLCRCRCRCGGGVGMDRECVDHVSWSDVVQSPSVEECGEVHSGGAIRALGVQNWWFRARCGCILLCFGA